MEVYTDGSVTSIGELRTQGDVFHFSYRVKAEGFDLNSIKTSTIQDNCCVLRLENFTGEIIISAQKEPDDGSFLKLRAVSELPKSGVKQWNGVTKKVGTQPLLDEDCNTADIPNAPQSAQEDEIPAKAKSEEIRDLTVPDRKDAPESR